VGLCACVFMFKSIGSSIDIVSLGVYRVSLMGCFCSFACLLVYVILTPEKAFEKLVISQYGKLLLTSSCPYQLLLLQDLFPYMQLERVPAPQECTSAAV